MPKTAFARQGQALGEYGLVAGLIAVVAIGGLMLLGQNVTGLFNNMLPDPKSAMASVGGGTAINVASVNALPANLQKASSLLPPPKANEQQVCFKSGFCLNIPLIESKATSTAGSLGDQQMSQMADVLDQTAQQLAAVGADPPLVGLITKLANNGHSISDYYTQMDGSLAEARTQCGDQCTMNYYTNPDAFNAYRWDGAAYSATNEFQSSWLTVETYMKENPQAFAAFPEAYNIISMETQEILKMSGGVSNTYADDPNAKLVKEKGSSSAVQKETTTYVSPSTGEKITETKYTVDGNMVYQTLATSKGTTSYTWDGPDLVPTKEKPPTDGASTYTYTFPSQYTLTTNLTNVAQPIRQDANTICQVGGNMGSCYVIGSAPASKSTGSTGPTATATNLTNAVQPNRQNGNDN